MHIKRCGFGFCLLVFFLAPLLHGQTTGEITGGAGFELNTISLTDVAGGIVVYGSYNLSPRFVLGLKIGTYTDIREMNSAEGEIFFRWYFHKLGTLPLEHSFDPLPRWAFFAQAGAGAGVYAAFIEPLETRPSVLGEAAVGLRIYFSKDSAPVFFEPYVRYAYPSGFGVGFIFGG
jgi:hypothetical protein